jgi:hypothetical protein
MATSTLEIEDISYGVIVMRHNYFSILFMVFVVVYFFALNNRLCGFRPFFFKATISKVLTLKPCYEVLSFLSVNRGFPSYYTWGEL